MWSSNTKKVLNEEETREAIIDRLDVLEGKKLEDAAVKVGAQPIYKVVPEWSGCCQPPCSWGPCCPYLPGYCFSRYPQYKTTFKDHYPGKERPYFSPKQVLCPSQIQVGKRYAERHCGGTPSEFIVLSEPYQDYIGWWIDVRYARWPSSLATKMSLADRSTTPYIGDGLWNVWNWMEFVDDEQYDCYRCPPCCCYGRLR